jgi:hypothetical protein
MMLKKLFSYYSGKSREKRARMFMTHLKPQATDRILDLGGGNGNYMAATIPFRENVYVADILTDQLRVAREKFGFNTIELGEDGRLDFPDGYFDIVFCNSVIEHVTVNKDEVWNIYHTKQFSEQALARQKLFANEIRRIARAYYVQTPNKFFWIESHTWLPGLIAILPRRILLPLLKFTNRFWPKKTAPDWNLLTEEKMKWLFPDAEIFKEKSLGLVKSLIAIRK